MAHSRFTECHMLVHRLQIFGPESDLNLQDHLALAGTCRRIRAAYTDDIWNALVQTYPRSSNRNSARHIFSNAFSNSLKTRGKSVQPLYSVIRARIAGTVNRAMIPTASVRSFYKLPENAILSLPFETRQNPRFASAAPMRLFRAAQVYALTMRMHGGPLGHKAHLKKLEARGTKAKATREKNKNNMMYN